jgi:hypothetical protein
LPHSHRWISWRNVDLNTTSAICNTRRKFDSLQRHEIVTSLHNTLICMCEWPFISGNKRNVLFCMLLQVPVSLYSDKRGK